MSRSLNHLRALSNNDTKPLDDEAQSAAANTATASPTAASSHAPNPPHLAEPSILRLMQLVSPLFPVGGYAYSQGLEQAIEQGWVSSPQSLYEWLQGLLHNGVARLDLPILVRAHAAWLVGDAARAASVAKLALALRGSRELFEEDRKLGSALARTLHGLQITEASAQLEQQPASYPVLFALACAKWAIPVRSAALAFAYVWCETQVSAASRLMAVGQTDCQKVLSQLLETIPAAVDTAMQLDGPTSDPWHRPMLSRLLGMKPSTVVFFDLEVEAP
jgi:urease accessory protein